MSSNLNYILATEPMAGAGGGYSDTLNRALRNLLSLSGYNPDATIFPGLMGPMFNAKAYLAAGDGTTDDAAKLVSCDAAAAAAGGCVWIPDGSYRVASNVTFTAPVVMSPKAKFVPDATFSVTGVASAHGESRNSEIAYALATQGGATTFINTKINPPKAGGGSTNRRHFGMSVEMDIRGETRVASGSPNSNDRCAAYFATIADNGGNPFGLNALVQLNAGFASLHPGITCEIDMNNYAAAGKGVGLKVTGIGSFQTFYGLHINRADGGGTPDQSAWQEGFRLENFVVGMHILPGPAATTGLYFDGGMSAPAGGWIKIKPLDDLSLATVAISIVNAADSVQNFTVTKAGDIGCGIVTVRDTASVIRSSVALTNYAAAATATMTNAPAAGNPTKWIGVNDNGTVRKIPAW